MTNDDLKLEWRVICETRLGNLCPVEEPTTAQEIIARDEADAHCDALRKQGNNEQD